MIGVGHLDVLSGIGDLNCIGFGIGNEAEWTLALGDGIFAEVKRLSLGGTVLADGDGIDDLALLEVNRTIGRSDILRRGDGKLGTFKTTIPVNRLILDNRLFIDRLGGFCRSCGLLGGSGCCFRGRSGVLGRNGCFLCRSSCFLCDSWFGHFFLVDGCKNIAGLKDGDRAFFCLIVFFDHNVRLCSVNRKADGCAVKHISLACLNLDQLVAAVGELDGKLDGTRGIGEEYILAADVNEAAVCLLNFKAEARERNCFLALGVLLHDCQLGFLKDILKAYGHCFAVFNLNGLRLLRCISVGMSFCNGVGAGQQTCQAELAIFVGLCCLIVILACDSEFDISYNAVLRSFDDFEVAPLTSRNSTSSKPEQFANT